MCELFAMTTAAKAIITADLDAFAREGGERNLNRDGWGIMIAEDRDAHVFREAAPASHSALAKMVFEREFASRNVLAHVRRASQGGSRLANTHPFTRVHSGKTQHFAHNGDLDGIATLGEAQSLLKDVDLPYAFTGSGKKEVLRGRPVAFALWSESKKKWMVAHVELPRPPVKWKPGRGPFPFRVLTPGIEARHEFPGFRKPGCLLHDFTVMLAALAGQERQQREDAGIARSLEGERPAHAYPSRGWSPHGRNA